MARKSKDRGILQVGENWYVRLYQNGRERRFKCDNKTQAKALYARLKADEREGRYFPKEKPKDITVRMAVDRYLASSTNRSIKTERHHGQFWNAAMGEKLLTHVTAEDCQRIQGRLVAEGRLSKATINRMFAFFRHVLMRYVNDGYLARNPVSTVKFFKESNKTRYFTENELTHLRDLIPDGSWPPVGLSVEMGLRRSELFALKWAWVDFGARTVTLPMTKSGFTQHVPLSTEAIRLFRSLNSFTFSPYVFPGRNPLKPMDARAFVRRVFEPALKQAGIEGASWHTLRHTCASRLVMGGVPLVTVKEILGHKDIQTTLKYSHLSQSHIHEAVEKASFVKNQVQTVTPTVTTENRLRSFLSERET